MVKCNFIDTFMPIWAYNIKNKSKYTHDDDMIV